MVHFEVVIFELMEFKNVLFLKRIKALHDNILLFTHL